MRVDINLNNLAREVMDFLSLEVFKSRLDGSLKYIVQLQEKLQI